jgi:hypothetical protein
MDDTAFLGTALNQLGQTVKDAAKQVVKIPSEMAKDAGEQIMGSKSSTPNEQNQTQKQGWKSDEERVKFLKDLYGAPQPLLEIAADKKDQGLANKKTETKQTSANPLVKSEENKKPSEFQEQIADKSLEEQKKLMELRNQLHKDAYFDPTFNPVKKQEERPAEKVENEKKQEMQDLQKKEEDKPQPIAVVREQNKAEQFRGAAG